MSHLTLIPAYGRDYKSKNEVLLDWKADKDFMSTGFHGNGATNRPDIEKMHPDGIDVNIRYKGQRNILVITSKQVREKTYPKTAEPKEKKTAEPAEPKTENENYYKHFRMTYSSEKSLDILRDIFSVSRFSSSEEGHYAFDSVNFRFFPAGLIVEATDGRRLIQRKFSTSELFENEISPVAHYGTEDVRPFNVSESMAMVQDMKTAGEWAVLFPATIGRFSIPKTASSARLTITPESIELDVWNKKNDCKTFKAVARDSGVFPDTDKLLPKNGNEPAGITIALSADYLADMGKVFKGQAVYLTLPVDDSDNIQKGTISVVPNSNRAGKSVAILAPFFYQGEPEDCEFYRPVMFDNK